MVYVLYVVGTLVASHWLIDLIDWNHHHQFGRASKKYWPMMHSIDMLEYLIAIESHFQETDVFISKPNVVTLLITGLYNLHIYYRLYECITKQIPSSARMHIGGFLVGLIFYITTPVTLTIDSLYEPGWQQPSWLSLVLGTLLFFYAFVHQCNCHDILYKLRTNQQHHLSESNSSSQDYGIPTGDWFRYVSCPHYFCEILMYFALFMLTGFQSFSALCILLDHY